ncbi:MAG: 30S ribosomal protein S19e [Nitrosopumilaceae archaeon]|nr:30S ribosomal protein S19e [Nitrosopumilaceae archaeon]NIT99919.1 30S ribosomal protein S19e [Nitrosopumilaceae archaeon]NIU86272.1 30S ribosomal protein S19e [Nitrosopumilaceae archaeon]NIV65027.1 30S ribosomal protein S19e [Nitrosopumilaceae archaeon]NIX60522.1 30S ribosomal protein S19e [Nitrosopumilaceae archaeon]
MAKVYDVPPDVLISKLSEILKGEDIPPPSWITFVKTGSHKEKPPYERDWWYTRCASILRKVYLHGPIGINELRKEYGGAYNGSYGYGARHHKDAAGAIIRHAVQSLEKLGYIEKVERKGRVASKQGMQKMDKLASDILNEISKTNPQLKIYS